MNEENRNEGFKEEYEYKEAPVTGTPQVNNGMFDRSRILAAALILALIAVLIVAAGMLISRLKRSMMGLDEIDEWVSNKATEFASSSKNETDTKDKNRAGLQSLPEAQEKKAAPMEPVSMGNWNWTLEDGVLTISGTGAMDDFDTSSKLQPWKDKSSSIRKAVICEGITTVGKNTFRNCANLAEVEIPEGVYLIAENAFNGCSSLETIRLPDSVEIIEEDAFCLCGSLKSITIPVNVREIGADAFFCAGVEEIRVAKGNGHFAEEDNVLYTKDGKTLLFYPDDPSRTAFSIPSGVQVIGDFAFPNGDHLTSIVIPTSVISIGYTAFRFLDSIRTFTYEGSAEQWDRIRIMTNNDDLTQKEFIFLK